MSFSDYFDRIYVNHLPHRIDRLKSINYQFQIMKSKFEFFDAIQHLDGSVGNKLSFIGIILKAIDRKEKHILFCEDDVLFRQCIQEDIGPIIEETQKQDLDILCFHHPQPCNIDFDNQLIIKKRKPWCNQCLYLNNLEKIFEYMKKRENSQHGLDFTLVNSSLLTFITAKEYALQLDDYSDIGKRVCQRFKHKKIYPDLLERPL